MNRECIKSHDRPYLLWIFLVLAVTHGLAHQQTAAETVRQFANANLEKLSLRVGNVQNLIVRLDYVDASTGIEHIYATQKISGLSVPGSNLSLHTKGARVIESNNSIPTASYSVKPINASVTLLQAILQPSSSEPTTSNRFFFYNHKLFVQLWFGKQVSISRRIGLK